MKMDFFNHVVMFGIIIFAIVIALTDFNFSIWAALVGACVGWSAFCFFYWISVWAEYFFDLWLDSIN